MAQYPAVILSKSDHISKAQPDPWVTTAVEEAFLAYAHGGKGILFLHSGTAGFQGKPVLRGLIGGVFIRHPKQCLVAVEPRTGHPLTRGATPFTAKDEHYFVTVDDAEADLFMTTTSMHGTRAGGWTRLEGDGRICVLTPGHNLPVWLHPSFQALLVNALNWCAGE